MSTNGIKLSINNATKNSLKRRVYVCQPWPGPLGADPRYVEITSVLLSFFCCLALGLFLVGLVTPRHFGPCLWLCDK